MKKTKLLYIYPDFGGIYDYSKIIYEKVYSKWQDFTIEYIAINNATSAMEIQDRIDSFNPKIVHFEMGSNDWKMYKISQSLLRKNPKIKQVVTLHDVGIIIAHPSGWLLPSGRTPLLAAKKIVRKLYEDSIRMGSMRQWLSNKNIRFIVLRGNSHLVADYLPLVIVDNVVEQNRMPRQRINKIGFVGFWSENKGIKILIDAFNIVQSSSSKKLIIYSGPAGDEDSFTRNIRTLAKDRKDINLPGHITDGEIVQTISRLDIIVLPYQPDNPAGSSAIAMQAALSGTPIVASEAPQLKEVLGGGANYYSPADNPRALADKICEIMKNYNLAAKKATGLQERIVKQRSPEVIGAKLHRIINSL